MKQASNNQERSVIGRSYVNSDGELYLSCSADGERQPTHIAVVVADNREAITLNMLLTGLSEDMYIRNLAAMCIMWLTDVQGYDEDRALSLVEEPLVISWWNNHFMIREKSMAATLSDYYHKRVQIQPRHLSPKLKQLAAQSETRDFWLRLHLLCFKPPYWQHRHLQQSWLKLKH